jgi:Calcium-binding EGF domain
LIDPLLSAHKKHRTTTIMSVKIVVLLLALVGSAAAQLRPPSKINICAPIGNNVYSTVAVLPTEVSKYPGHVKGACTKVCATVCKDLLREVNAAGQCICKGSALKCGANAKPSNDKKSCKCLVGFKGDPLKGCVDVNECATTKTVCPERHGCINTVGSFECQACGENTRVVNNQCQCEDGYEGDAHSKCTDINECTVFGNELCAKEGKTCLHFERGEHSADYVCFKPFTCQAGTCKENEQCVDSPEGTKCVKACDENAVYNQDTNTCRCKEQDGYFGNSKRGDCTRPPPRQCHSKALFDEAQGKCVCKNGRQGDGYTYCGYDAECGANSGPYEGSCECFAGFVGPESNRCYGCGPTRWGECVCDSGFEGMGCSCGENAHEENDICTCDEGYENWRRGFFTGCSESEAA